MSRPIPLVDLKAQHGAIRGEIDAAIAATIEESAFILGERVAAFEREFAAFVGARHGVGTSSGTSALHLALVLAGVGAGDEVILPSHTFIASVEAIRLCGARPVFADIEEETYLIDAAEVERAWTPKTRAIVPVHLYGRCCDMGRLAAIARERGVAVIEDAAQAHGATCEAGRAGAMGDAAAFSFYPGKNLGALGDAGMVTTANAEWAERARRLANHGRTGKHEHAEFGYNYRLDALQAAVLRVKLRHLGGWNAKRLALARRYNEAFEGTGIITPAAPDGHVFHLYVIRVDDRDRIQGALGAAGIASGIHYPIPCHLQPWCREFADRPLRVTERIDGEILSLPLYPELTSEDQGRVIEAVLAAVRSA